MEKSKLNVYFDVNKYYEFYTKLVLQKKPPFIKRKSKE